ncbi:hypothetical protein GA0115240_163538 [Streptomyces sp. DvalAA-14]|nr:hypothetical protein GA0115240_163538 [Streptomyces sp. DvalAA-14]
MLGLCVIALTARLLDPSRLTFALEMAGLSAIGQLLTWAGMHGVWRSNGWDSGVLLYVWLGGFLGGMALTSAGGWVLTPIPLVAPLVATLARWRLHRTARSAGVPR